MASGNSLGGGFSKGNVKNLKTYLGQNAGRLKGILDDVLGVYARGQQQAGAQNDLLFGGKKYGAAKQFFGPGGQSGQDPSLSRGGRAPNPATTRGGQGDEGKMSVTGYDPDYVPPEGEYHGSGRGNDAPQWDPESSGNEAPEGGLVGDYQNWQDNPWQTGPNGDLETDALGAYDWMASGNRNDDESNVYRWLGDVGNEKGYGDLSKADLSGLEGEAGDIYGSLGEANANGLEGEGINASRELGQRGADVGTASDTYRGMVEHGGYDDATKAALTRESLAATRNPFERARDRTLRGAAARGNVGSTAGTEIQMANQEATALGDAASKNQMNIFGEQQRQKEAGASGLMGTQGITNAAKQASIQDLGNINQGMVNRRGMAAAGQAGLSKDVTGRRLGALAGKQGVLSQMAGENARQRDTALKGVQGKEGMFNTMFGRKQAGVAGKQGLYNAGQQQRAGDLAGAANLGGKTSEDYVESGTGGGGL